MFRELRRQDCKMDDESIKKALLKAEYGTLSTVDSEGNPYGVPVSFVYREKDQAIYFHCAREGHKLDNLAVNNKASFCVVSEAQTLPHRFSVKYQSVIVFGRVTEVIEEEKREALTAFLTKYSGEFMEKGLKYLEADEPNCRVIKLEIKNLTGKKRST